MMSFAVYTAQLMCATTVRICPKCKERHDLEDLPPFMRRLPATKLVILAKVRARMTRQAAGRHHDAVERVRAFGPSCEADKQLN